MTKFADPIFPTVFSANPTEFRKFDKDLITVLGSLSNNLKLILDAGIDFDDNIDCVFITYTSNVVANTQDTIAHGLGKIPIGFVVIDRDKAGVVFRSGSSTSVNLFLKCNVASTTMTLMVF